MAKKRQFASSRTPKCQDLIIRVRNAVKTGHYWDVTHARCRGEERKITRPEYEFVLLNGAHEPSKDEYKDEFKEWNYAIRGKTIDDRELRVVVSFDSEDMLVITLIDLEG